MKSRQGPIPQGKPLEEQVLFDLARNLLNQIVTEGRVWPCANLSLSVGGFEEGVTGNMGIGAFLVKGEEAQALRQGTRESSSSSLPEGQSSKRRRIDDGGIHRFLTKQATADEDVIPAEAHADSGSHRRRHSAPKDFETPGPVSLDDRVGGDPSNEANEANNEANNTRIQTSIALYACPRCDAGFEDFEDLQSHEDWHMAKDLQEEERVKPTTAHRPPAARAAPGAHRGSGSSRRGARGAGRKMEQGQSKLKFG